MSALSLPWDDQPGQPNNINHVMENDEALRDNINGDNLSADVRAACRTLAFTTMQLATGETAGTYFLQALGGMGKGGVSGVGTLAPQMIPFDPADLAITGPATKLRIRSVLHVPTATAPGVNFTMGMYPLSSLVVSGGNYTATLGAAVGSVARNTPAGNSQNFDASADFDVPAQDAYILGVAVSGTLAGPAVVSIALQSRYV